MKKIYLIALAIFMTLGFSSAWAGKDEIRRGGLSEEQVVTTPTDLLVSQNSHVLRYIKSDLSAINRSKFCTPKGFYTNDPQYRYTNCQDFRSRSQGTTWRVLFGRDGNAEAVFQVASGNPVPWVQFKEGTQQAIYESPGAQQYAMAHGGGTSQPAMAQENPRQPAPTANSSGPCAGLSGAARAMCDNASRSLPALGGLFGK